MENDFPRVERTCPKKVVFHVREGDVHINCPLRLLTGLILSDGLSS
jgi:hypothetical protein